MRIRGPARSVAVLLALAALVVAAVCPRGVLATLRLLSLGEVPVQTSGAAPEIAEAGTDVVVAIAPLIRRRMLAPPAPPPPTPDSDGAASLPVALTLVALLAGWALSLRRPAPSASRVAPTWRGRGPPLPLATSA